MRIIRNFATKLLGCAKEPSTIGRLGFGFDLATWNRIGRAKAHHVCAVLEGIIDHQEDSEEDFFDDARSEELADAVLKEIIALNERGKWQLARARFDPAYQPFRSHMGDTGLHAVVILGPDSFLVRLGDEVLHIDDGKVAQVEGVSMFAISRNRHWLVIAGNEGLRISVGFDAAPHQLISWPDDIAVDPSTLRSLDIANDGKSIVLASDEFGIWFAKDGAWTLLAPRPGVGDDGQDEEGNEDTESSSDTVRNLGTDTCPVYIGSYAQIKAAFGGPLGIDATHAALSPDGRYVAYGWQDSWGGHYVDRVTETAIEPLGRIEAQSDYPYQVRFTDDSRKILSNSRYGSSGITVCRHMESLATDTEEAHLTDEYLRAYSITELPGTRFALDEPVAFIGGAGWSHAAPLVGGKPVFTHLFGSALRAFDYDPASGRVAVASASGVLHVLDPFTEAEPGRERGYHPRRELFRWIFWETLDAPIRW